MPSTNLIVALVFAALFGAGLVFFALYFIHCYIRNRCLELDHWFRRLIPKQLRLPCRHCEGTGRDFGEKSRSRSSHRESRSRSRAQRGRSRYERSVFEADTEWNAIGPKDGVLRGGRQSPRPALPPAPTVQSPGVTEHYNPWQTSSPQMNAQPAINPQAYTQMPQQPYPRGAPQFEPHPMLAPLPSYQARPVSSSAGSVPTYHKPSRQSRTERPKTSPRSRSRQVLRDGTRVRTTDFIHIVDDYPPIVKEAIRKAAEKQEPVLSSALSSTDSSTSTEPIEEVPRASIPRATPRFANPSPFPFTRFPERAAQAWNMPSTFPPQWNHDGGPVEQVRYASPYTRPGVWVSSPKDMRRPRHDPSNTLLRRICISCCLETLLTSAGHSPDPPRRRPAKRRESRTRTLRRSRKEGPQDRHEQYVRWEYAEEVEVQKRAEAPDQAQSSTSNLAAGSCKTKSTEQRALSHNGIPLLSPMPVPIVEEPVSDCGSVKVVEEVTDRSSSAAKSQARTPGSAVRSPSAHV